MSASIGNLASKKDHISFKAELCAALVAAADEPEAMRSLALNPAVGSTFDRLTRLANSPPVPGYEPFLLKRGMAPLEAHVMALAILRFSERWAGERQLASEFTSLVKRVARGRSSRRDRTRLRLLIAKADILAACKTAGVTPGLDAIGNLERALGMEEDTAEPAKWVAASRALRPTLPESRGRQMSTISAAHFFLLDLLRDMGDQRAYTLGLPKITGTKEDFIDEVTAATRIAFGKPRFNPQASQRFFKKTSGAVVLN